MSSAPDAPRQVSWESFLVLSIFVARASVRLRRRGLQLTVLSGLGSWNACPGAPGLRRAAKTRRRTSRISCVQALDALVPQKNLSVTPPGQDYLAV